MQPHRMSRHSSEARTALPKTHQKSVILSEARSAQSKDPHLPSSDSLQKHTTLTNLASRYAKPSGLALSITRGKGLQHLA
jgi:hypothetical protein